MYNKLKKPNSYLLVVLIFALYELLEILSCLIFFVMLFVDPDSFELEHVFRAGILSLIAIAFIALLLHYIVNKKIGRQIPVIFAAYAVLYNVVVFVNEFNHIVHISVFYGVSIFLNLICGIFIAAFLELLIFEKYTKYHDLAKKHWYVPAIAYIIIQVISQVAYGSYSSFGAISGAIASGMLSAVPFALGILFLCLYLKDSLAADIAEDYSDINENDCFRSMTAHVLLLLFTFGIYFWIWIYKTTEFTNSIPNTQYRRNPTIKLLLCMFVPFYYLYWVHYTCKEIERYSKSKDVPCNISTLCVVLAIFTYYFVSPIIMQSKLNEAIQYTTVIPAEQPPAAEETLHPKALETENIDALKQYKELLDSGILTQEEFDAKKRQLLGL